MRRKILLSVLALIALVVCFVMLLVTVGLLTPKSHVVTKTLKLKQKPEIIWQTIKDFQNQPSWRSELQTVERMPDHNGKEMWKEIYKNGDELLLETSEDISQQCLIRTIADKSLPFSGTWEMTVRTEAEGSSLTITERGEIPNPFFRGIVKMFFGYEETVIHFETELAKKFGEVPVIE